MILHSNATGMTLENLEAVREGITERKKKIYIYPYQLPPDTPLLQTFQLSRKYYPIHYRSDKAAQSSVQNSMCQTKSSISSSLRPATRNALIQSWARLNAVVMSERRRRLTRQHTAKNGELSNNMKQMNGRLGESGWVTGIIWMGY